MRKLSLAFLLVTLSATVYAGVSTSRDNTKVPLTQYDAKMNEIAISTSSMAGGISEARVNTSTNALQGQITNNKTDITALHVSTQTYATKTEVNTSTNALQGQITGLETFSIQIPFSSTATTTSSMINQQQQIYIPYGWTPTEWSVIANTVGNFSVEITTAYFDVTPEFGNSITGSDNPRLVSSMTSSSTALSGWGGGITGGKILNISVTDATVIDWVTLTIIGER